MPDTERSLAELLTIYADNTEGGIDAQQARDLIVTALGGYASIRVLDGGAAQGVTGTPATFAAFTADGPAAGATPDHATDKITIGTTGVYWVDFSADVEASVTGSFYAALAANGTATGTHKAEAKFEAAGGETRHLGFAGPVELDAGDEVTILVSGAVGNLITRQAQLSLKRIG